MDVKQPEAPDPAPGQDHGDDPILLTGWMTRAEVAAELKLSTDTLQRWENQRIGPPTMRLGRRVYYRAEAFREWLVSRERKAPETVRKGWRR
jgi:predicted DNA-binding transcriptional regulator AlpA